MFMQVHSKNFNVGVQSLMLLDKISSKNKIVSDRFYRALYSKLLLSSAMNSSKASSILCVDLVNLVHQFYVTVFNNFSFLISG